MHWYEAMSPNQFSPQIRICVLTMTVPRLHPPQIPLYNPPRGAAQTRPSAFQPLSPKHPPDPRRDPPPGVHRPL